MVYAAPCSYCGGTGRSIPLLRDDEIVRCIVCGHAEHYHEVGVDRSGYCGAHLHVGPDVCVICPCVVLADGSIHYGD